MTKKVIMLESHNSFKGLRGSLTEEGDIIKKRTKYDEGVNTMDATQKEYIDHRIDSLEKSIDQRFTSTESILSEKMDHLYTKMDSSMDKKLNAFKDDFVKEQKQQTQNTRTNTIAIVALFSTIIIGVLGFLF